MGTQTQTTSNQQSGLQFDPSSMMTYQNLTKSGGNVLNQYMNNPLSNPFFNLGQSQGQSAAMKLGGQNMSMLQQMMRTSDLAGGAGQGWLGAQKAKTGRANQSMRSQANLSGIMNAFQRQMGATGMGMSFSPLVTGQTSKGQQTQSTGGLGTWLPQLIGTGMGAAMMGMSGGMGGGMPFTSGGAPTAMQGVTGVTPGSSMFSGFPSGLLNNNPAMPSFAAMSMGGGLGT